MIAVNIALLIENFNAPHTHEYSDTKKPAVHLTGQRAIHSKPITSQPRQVQL
jgi:hypothetical protein